MKNRELTKQKLRRFAQELKLLGERDLETILKILVVMEALGETKVVKDTLIGIFNSSLDFQEICESFSKGIVKQVEVRPQ